MTKLGYWKIRGLAQPIRLLLNYVGVQFEDMRFEQGDPPTFDRGAWTSVKTTFGLDFPNLPFYIDEESGVKMTQSNAILRYIARKHDSSLLGANPDDMWKVDMLMEESMDFRNAIVRLVYNRDYPNLIDDWVKSYLVPRLESLARFLNHDWFAGSHITVPDFIFYELLDQVRIMAPGCLDKHANLLAFLSRFEKLPAIAQYMASADFLYRPINNKVAMFK
mmetsp:Transcript_5605/g.9692  ORF Transcript_5605/g.9692 Transcript_5605/m.9692 type:complete len:220 (-) Transcript_5605:77-736(-)|eukprot:CAMPEP_0196655738 /NCGR_PEP_ID=MMETSP1086-20130531/7237_1 /TAXON_ID=77921 /ORGANISM="Cyanoptyche  gloeocystis , Strain SAG4.97" /LENGTH=219 /DNA_ID=CAMNT_0041988211 /DNA_START=64 /DNA_END=723 /DNA_ORIENTATION=+